MAKEEKKLQSFNSFNAGEYSPELAGRVDLQSFGSSVRYMSNMMSQVSGGVKKFYGTTHVDELEKADGVKIKLVPFINNYEPMSFVFWKFPDDVESGEKSIKVGLICGNTYRNLDILFPATIDVDEMRWKQINDVVVFVHKTTQPLAIKFFGKDENGGYRFVSEGVSFKEIPYFPIGTTRDYIGTLEADGIRGKVNITIPGSKQEIRAYFPNPLNKQSSYVRSKHFSMQLDYVYFNVEKSYITLYRKRGGVDLELCSGVCNTTTRANQTTTDTITTEKVFQVIKSFFPSALLVEDYISITDIQDHEDGDSYYMSLSIGRGFIAHTDVVPFPAEFYVSQTYSPLPIDFDVLKATDWVGRKIKFYISSNFEVSPWWQGKDVTNGDYAFSNGHWYKARQSGTCGNVQPSHVSGVRSDGGVAWEYVHSGSTSATVTDVVDSSTISILVDGVELPANKHGDVYVFDNYAWSIWGLDGVHPSDVYMVGNRLGFVCNTSGYGAWNSLSVVDDYFNFSTEEYGQQLDTSAIINLIPNNESGIITWVLSRKNVYMGSYSGEFNIKAPNDVLTPIGTKIDNISNVGGCPVVPLKYKELNLFVGMTGKELYTIGYDYTIEDYTPQSLGYMTEHIMDKGVRRMEALNNKDRNIYLLHETNELSLFHYVKEQKILGFSSLCFGCDVIDFVTTYSKNNVVGYVATQRNDGFIAFEMVSENNCVYMFDVVDVTTQDNKFVPIKHHANKEVWVKFGEDLSQFKKVTLDAEGNTTEIPDSPRYQVGLPMVCELHTQPAFGNKVEGMQQQSIAVYLRLNKSGAFYYGASVDFDKYFEYSDWPDRQEFGEGRALYTGDCALNIPLGYAEAANQGDAKYPNSSAVGINIKCNTPEPFNLLAIQEIYK